MDANLQSDFTIINSFLQKMLDIMERSQITDAQAKLGEKLLKAYKSHSELEFRVVSKEYAQEIIDKLTLHNIPCMWSPNRNGDYTLILPPDKKYGYNYGHYIEEVLMHYPEYYKQLSKNTWTHLAQVDEVRGVVGFRFNSELEAEIFKNKAFADGHGIVTTDISKNGMVTVYCREADLFTEGNHKDAISALIDTEYSLDNSIQHFGRCYAVAHDIKQADRCMQYIEEGQSFVIHNGATKESDYIQYENDTLTFYKWDSELRKFEGREIHADISDKESMRKLLEYHVARIHNEQIDTIEDFEHRYSILGDMPSEEMLKKTYVDKQKQLYSEVINPAMKMFRGKDGSIDTHSLMAYIDSPSVKEQIKRKGLENVRPAFSRDFLKDIRHDIELEMQELQGELQKYENMERDFKSREQDFRDNLQKSRMSTVGLTNRVVVADAPIEDILAGLQEQNQYLESKLHEICVGYLGKVPSSDPKVLVRAFLMKGIDVPNREQAVALIKKAELTPEETEQLNAIANESLFCLVKEKRPDAERYYLARGIVTGKINELSNILSRKEMQQESYREDYQKLCNNIRSCQDQIQNMDILIENEEVRAEKITSLDRECHAFLKKQKEQNPGLTTSGLLRSLKEYMERKNEPIDKTVMTYQSMDSFTQVVQKENEEQIKAQEEMEQENTPEINIEQDI